MILLLPWLAIAALGLIPALVVAVVYARETRARPAPAKECRLWTWTLHDGEEITLREDVERDRLAVLSATFAYALSNRDPKRGRA